MRGPRLARQSRRQTLRRLIVFSLSAAGGVALRSALGALHAAAQNTPDLPLGAPPLPLSTRAARRLDPGCHEDLAQIAQAALMVVVVVVVVVATDVAVATAVIVAAHRLLR